MPNTKTLVHDPKLKVLIWSPSGMGKTSLIGTAAKLGKGYIFDTDQRIQVLGGLDIDYDTYHDKRGQCQAYDKMEEKLISLERNCPYEFVALDGLTPFVNIIAMNKAMQQANAVIPNQKRMGETPALGDYNAFKTLVMRFVARLAALPCHVFVTGHELESREAITGRVLEKYLAVPGQAGDLLPGTFNEVWSMEIRMKANAQGQNETTHLVRTRPTNMISARTCYREALNELEVADFPTIYGKIQTYLRNKYPQDNSSGVSEKE